jgi:hypothetical protein
MELFEWNTMHTPSHTHAPYPPSPRWVGVRRPALRLPIVLQDKLSCLANSVGIEIYFYLPLPIHHCHAVGIYFYLPFRIHNIFITVLLFSFIVRFILFA